MSTFIDCNTCARTITLPVEKEDIVRWRMSGIFVQDFFPDLSPNDREILITGTCSFCFDELFPVEVGCNDLCVTAADLGLPEYGDVVAHAHPDCPEHS